MIRVNGEQRPLESERLSDLLEQLGHEPEARGVAVAVNGEFVPRASWPARELRAGDEVEIVGAVQGG